MRTFEQWLNRPVYKVQVHTAQIAKQILGLPDGDLATGKSSYDVTAAVTRLSFCSVSSTQKTHSRYCKTI
jgi:hypothetical protein